MSFDILLYTCTLGTKTRQRPNPFTGEAMLAPDDPGLSQEEREAVLRLLNEVKAVGPDAYHFYALTFPDGGLADLHTDPLDGTTPCTGFGVEVRGLTPDVVAFLFRLARAGNMCIAPIGGDAETILTKPPGDETVRERWPDAVVVDSPEQLTPLLADGYGGWARYRDQVVGEP